MPKRQRTTQLSDDDWAKEDSSLSEPEADSDGKDASFRPRRKNITVKKVVKRKKVEAGNSEASFATEFEGERLSVHHSSSIHSIQEPGEMRTALLGWYQTVNNIRGMPWRKAYDPMLGVEERAQRAYEVWISEIMLQQTQVATVIPYYNRWIAKFPTIRHLADANIDEVNALWKGLGYYSRASRLLQGAQKAVKDYDGRLPNNAKDMEANIPGIGRYSAGAICSIAYGEQVPVLDGNVHRLLSRILALHANPKAKSTLDILWAGATTMIEIEAHASNNAASSSTDKPAPQHPGDINQALIELGSTICKANLTDIEDICRVCEPLVGEEAVTSYPMKIARKKAREELDIINVMEWRSTIDPESRQFLMVRRPEGGLLGGLYEFPSCVNVAKDITPAAQIELSTDVLTRFLASDSPPISTTLPVGDVVHVFSHIKKTYRVQWVVIEGGVGPPIVRTTIHNQEKPAHKKVKAKGATAKRTTVADGNPSSAIWVPLEEVMNKNMGTGVVKIWHLTKRLWEGHSSS